MDPVTLGIAASAISGIIGGSAAKKAKRAAKRKAKMLSKKLDFLENNRQVIINPYEGITAIYLFCFLSNPALYWMLLST